jgi:hypothetical protein
MNADSQDFKIQKESFNADIIFRKKLKDQRLNGTRINTDKILRETAKNEEKSTKHLLSLDF